MESKSQSTSQSQAQDMLESQDGGMLNETSSSFEQEASAALASQGLKLVREVHYQAKLQFLIDLAYEPILELKDSLFELLADTAPGFTAGNLKQGVRLILDKAAQEARKDLSAKDDIDLPIFDNTRPWHNAERFADMHNYQTFYTGNEFDCAPEYSRKPISEGGYLTNAPLFYVSKMGTLCNNWHVSTVVYKNSKSYNLTHDFMPINLISYGYNSYGMGQLFNGRFDRNKLSQASIDIQILYYLWYISANLVKAGAIMPKLIVNYESRLQCWWIPAVLSQEIRALVTKVGLFLQGYEHLFLHRVDRSEPMDPLFLGQLMLSGFIQSYVSWSFIWNAPEGFVTYDEFRVLFTCCSCDLSSSNVQEKALQQRLESWLSPLSINQLSFTPVLRFYDLSDPDILNSVHFKKLHDEISKSAQESYLQQSEAVSRLSQSVINKIDAAQDCIESSGEEEVSSIVLDDEQFFSSSMDNALNSFSQTQGVGLELGFTDLGDDIFNELRRRDLIDDSGFVPLSLILNESCCSQVRYECMRTATRLGSIAQILEKLFKATNNICIVPLHSLYDTLQIALKGLSLLGVRLILPRSLSNLAKPVSRFQLGLSKSSKNSISDVNSLLSLANILEFNWQLVIDERRLSANEFKVLLANSGKIVRFHDQFVYADPQALLKIQNNLKRHDVLTTNKMALLNAALSGQLEDQGISLSKDLSDTLKNLTSPQPIPLPEGLNATLRPYQKRGYEWLMHNLKVNIGSILADDMGLGKTLQVIAALLKLKQDGILSPKNQALIIVPTSLITNWMREIHSFAPSLTYCAVHGSANSSLSSIKTDIILTSYGTARSRKQDFKRRHFLLIVVDEAQAIKNRSTAVHRALADFNSDYFIAMSGTPVENHLIDYYSILDFTNRGVFGSVESFKKDFAIPIERDHNMETIQRFKNLTAPFIMRRLKSDKNIISDLPDKLTSDQFCVLTDNQVALYQSVVSDTMNKLNEMEDARERSSLVLTLIHKLRAICNSPAQFEHSCEHYSASDSGKVKRLLELVDSILSADGKALIFTQSVIMGKYLVEILKEHTGSAPQFLHGSVDIKERMQMVDRFQNDPSERLMLLSLRAAGTGLNLTAANFVIHFDLWWNPAVENQATDRAYRIGQKKNVQVYRFICANTFEERINEMLNNKRDLANMTVAQGEAWIGDLSNRQLKELFALSE